MRMSVFDILVVVGIAVAFIAVIVSSIRGKKAGKNSCGCDCCSCCRKDCPSHAHKKS